MSLQHMVQKRILEDMIGAVPSEWKVLILDPSSTTRSLTVACRMNDITEAGVTVVENVRITRQPLPLLDAVYFLPATKDAVECVISDCSKKTGPQYKSINLFFSQPITDDVMALIGESKAARHITELKELNLDFLAIEPQVFHFDLSDASFFSALFGGGDHDGDDRSSAVDVIARKLASVCATIGARPIVRYAAGGASGVAEDIANAVDSIASDAGGGGRQLDLVVLDRTCDVISPLLHELTYQAMVYDLLPMKEDCHYEYKYKTKGGDQDMRDIYLDDRDPIWVENRHKPLQEAIDHVLDEFDEFKANNKVSAMEKKKKKSGGTKGGKLKDVTAAMKALPAYQEKVGRYAQHIHLLEQCKKTMKANDLEALIDLEQQLCTGQDRDGKKIKKNMVPALTPFLRDEAVAHEDKLRLLALYLICESDVKGSDRSRLLDKAGLSDREDVLLNLDKLGVRLDKSALKGRKKTKRLSDDPLRRYSPFIRDVMKDQLEGSLSESSFPFVGDSGASTSAASKGKSAKSSAKSLKSGKSVDKRKWDKKGKGKKDSTRTAQGLLEGDAPLVVFVAGGVTFSETKAAYDLSRKYGRPVLIGSTGMITPNSFLTMLEHL